MSYQQAKARTRSKYLHSAIIVSAEEEGFYIYMMTAHAGTLVPFGRDWYATESGAKRHCLKTMKIKPTDWVAHDGEPAFAASVASAVDGAIKKHTKAMKKGRGSAGR